MEEEMLEGVVEVEEGSILPAEEELEQAEEAGGSFVNSNGRNVAKSVGHMSHGTFVPTLLQ